MTLRRWTATLAVCLPFTWFATACTGPAESDRASVAGPPGVVSTQARSARVLDLTVNSVALGRRAQVRLLLPTAFRTRPRGPWPVLYLLPGCCDSYQGWTRSTDVERMTENAPLLVVIPDGGRVGFYSDWLRGPGWETFHLRELRSILEADYGASGPWAVAGVSMGGFGALSYAARHPGLFKIAASFSGIVDTRSAPQAYLGLVRSEGGRPLQLWGDPRQRRDVWAAHNPYDLAPRLRGTALFLSVGDGNPGPLDARGATSDEIESSLSVENAALARRLHQLDIPVRTDFYGAGTHNWPYWQRELHRAWPMIEEALGLDGGSSRPTP